MSVEFKLLPPANAVKFLENKGFHIGFDWRDTAKEMHDVSFTVAKITQRDILEDVKREIDKAISQGLPFAEFQDNLVPTLAKKGWWGEREVVDELTGEIKKVNFNPARLRKIYDTNLRVAYSEGQWEKIQKLQKVFPYLEYVGCNSARPRTDHCSWSGIVLPVNHPWWLAHYPPKEWGCKCTVRQLTKSQAANAGISEEAPQETFVEWTNDRTGKVEKVPQGVHPAFNRPPGTWLQHLQTIERE